MGQKSRKLSIVSEETEDKFKEKFFPTLHYYEEKILGKVQDDGEYGFHYNDWFRYQGIKDFIMKSFDSETIVKYIPKDKRLFIISSDIKKFNAKRQLAPISIEVQDIFHQDHKSKSYGLMLLEIVIEHQEDWPDRYKDFANFEKLLIRYKFLKFLADLEKRNQELQKLFKEVSDEYEIQREVLRLELIVLLKVIPQLEPYKHYYEEVSKKIRKKQEQEEAKELALMKERRVELKLATDPSMFEPDQKNKNQKIKTSEKIIPFALFKKELEDKDHE